MVAIQRPLRSAMTMIELIFAIVIIAIVVAAVPQMISSNAEGSKQYLKQEVIAAATGEAFRILSMPWDSKSLDTVTIDGKDVNMSVILDTTGYYARNNEGIRNGMVPPIKSPGPVEANQFHRTFPNDNTNPASGVLAGVGNVDSNLLDDVGAQGYKNTYTLSVNSNFTSDGNGSTTYNFSKSASGQSNAKFAELNVSSSSATTNPILSLVVYKFNIGDGNKHFYTRKF
jgi:hypothetical protein